MKKIDPHLLDIPYKEALSQYPSIPEFFKALILDLPSPEEEKNLKKIFTSLNKNTLKELGIIREDLREQLLLFLENINDQLEKFPINSITIIGGKNKLGEKENVNLRLNAGEIISIVGATGAGKSRLLADIEWMAQKDTPTERQILINDQPPPLEWRYSIERKLVAQLSQNMNFVMDLEVREFLEMHGQSRMVENLPSKIELILKEANRLSGEAITPDLPLTTLSGGQSRALMIADTAYLSTSPIVLIDEIENAGIDRKKAINLLANKEKTVLIATHDPTLALMARKRLIIKNGGIVKIHQTTPEEEKCLTILEEMNQKILNCREKLRQGEILTLNEL